MITILVVDDSPSEMAKFRDILNKNNFAMLEANNGELGIELAKEHLPDLILMDIVMPEMNGFQATRRISRNESTAHIPIVMVSTKNQETDKVWGKRQGASDYVTKPFTEEELLTVIKKICKDKDNTPPHQRKKTSIDNTIVKKNSGDEVKKNSSDELTRQQQSQPSLHSTTQSRSSILDRIKSSFQL